MKILKVEQNTDEWMEARKGKITGSKLGDILSKRGTGKKLGFYELIADKLAIVEPDESPMDRGHRLEDEALSMFEEEIGMKFERGLFCVSDENENMAVSPDGLAKNLKSAVEVKCLNTPRFLQAYFEKKIPSEYDFQVLQYFIVNPDLETLYFVFYDPRVTAKPLHYLSFDREDMQVEVDMYKEQELAMLQEVDKLVEELAF